jgi:shikimate dehydrogenase
VLLPPSIPDEHKVQTGLVGRSITASRSPWMHEREAEAQALSLSYALFDFSDRQWDDGRLPDLLAECEAAGFAGLNITFPFKQAVLPMLDDLSNAARRIGAVNTVSFAGGRRIGYNTDVTGFAQSFALGLPDAAISKVVQIGAGGAGSATAQALLESGIEQLVLFDDDGVKLSRLVEKLQGDFGSDRIALGQDLAGATQTADGLVNATPMGMAKLPGLPLPACLIEQRHWVADIVYFPLETEFLREARLRGCRTLNGSGMAIHQAAGAFEIFTGLTPDRKRMQKSFMDFVSGPNSRTA